MYDDAFFENLDNRKEEANKLFKLMQYDSAEEKYNHLISLVADLLLDHNGLKKGDAKSYNKLKDLQAILYSNLGKCLFMNEEYEEAIENFENSLAHKDDNVKVYASLA